MDKNLPIYKDIITGLQEKEFTIFCGAGISKNSGFPLADEVKKYVLNKLQVSIKDDAFDFFEEEFNLPLTIERLCKMISHDKYNFYLYNNNTINWLNELLRIPKFYDVLRKRKDTICFSKEVIDLVNKTAKYRNNGFSSLSYDEQYNIRRLNRLILEEVYQKESPKSYKEAIMKYPFEAFVETLMENSNTSNALRFLDIFDGGSQNTNHILIAKLAKYKYLKAIFTTNFDLLIEKALESEGLRENVDFKRYYEEVHFSNIDFDTLGLFKIHGSVDNKESMRTTLKAVASKVLSDKRMEVTRNAFSTGSHKKVLILGYSCSDEFDITPQIQSIEGKRKEIIFIDHSDKIEEVENVGLKDEKNPFKEFSGKRIICNTDKFIKELWSSFQESTGEYKFVTSTVEWKTIIDDWDKKQEVDKGIKSFIAGLIFNNISNFRKAIEYYEKSLKIAVAIEDKNSESKCYGNLGNAYNRLGDFQKAVDYQEKSLKIKMANRDKSGEANCYGNLGNDYYCLGDFKKAIEHYEKSLKIRTAIRDKSGEANCYGNLGNTYNSLGDFHKAIEYCEESLKIDIAIGDKGGESDCYMNIGNAYIGLGDFQRATKYYEKALKIAKVIGSKHREFVCYLGLINTYLGFGDFKKSIEYLEKSLPIATLIGDKYGEADCYGNLGIAYNGLGDFKKAIEYHEKALKTAIAIGDKDGEATCYTNLGAVYCNISDFQKVLEYCEKALKIGIGNKKYESTCYMNAGIAYGSLGDLQKAIEYHEKALKICIAIGNKSGESKCYSNLGIDYVYLGNFHKTIEYCLKAEKLFNEIGQNHYQEVLYRVLSFAYEKIGDNKNAETYAKNCANIKNKKDIENKS